MPDTAKYLNDVVQAMSIKFNNLVYEKQSRGEDVIVLSLGEAFFDIPLYSFAEMPIPASYHYCHTRGIPDLRRQLAAYYAREYGVPVDPDTELMVTAGSKIAVHMALMAVLDPGDEVLIHEPAWVSYPEQTKLCHAVPVMIPYDRPIRAFEEYVTEKTRAIVINNPNNPKGSILTRQELEYLHALATKRNLYLIADEAYSDFLLDDDEFISCAALDPKKDHTIVCNSMSKNYGMSGWRIGYVIAGGKAMAELIKLNQHLMTCPATILEYYMAKHFDDILKITKPQIASVVRKRREVATFMDGLGLTYLPGAATFYFFVSIAPSTLGSEEFCRRLLADHGVSAVPGLGYGHSCDAFIRVSVGTESMERTKQGIELIHSLVKATATPSKAAAGTRARVPALD